MRGTEPSWRMGVEVALLCRPHMVGSAAEGHTRARGLELGDRGPPVTVAWLPHRSWIDHVIGSRFQLKIAGVDLPDAGIRGVGGLGQSAAKGKRPLDVCMAEKCDADV